MICPQEQPRASPNTGCSIAFQVMDDAVRYYLTNGDVAMARDHVERLANDMKFYSDTPAAYQAVLEKIKQRELELQLETEERARKQHLEMMMTLAASLSSMQSHGEAASASADAPTALPEPLSSEAAQAMLQQLQQAGMLDADYQPVGLSRTEAALLAYELARRLKITNMWKTFEQLWNRKNMRTDYNTALEQKKTLTFLDRIKGIVPKQS